MATKPVIASEIIEQKVEKSQVIVGQELSVASNSAIIASSEAKIDPNIAIAKDLKKSFAGYNEEGKPILRLQPATDEVKARQKQILDLHSQGKLQEILSADK